jgi:hypothetical protein
MFTQRHYRRLISAVACVALLLVSLAPALGQVLRTAPGSVWLEVCTARGSKWIWPDASGSERAPDSPAHGLQHCPLCLSALPALGLPPAADTALPSPELAHGVPTGRPLVPHTQHAWVDAQPRAPPSLS